MSDNPLADYDPMKDYNADPQAAWALLVRMARRARPGRGRGRIPPAQRTRGAPRGLSYDPVTDQKSQEWV